MRADRESRSALSAGRAAAGARGVRARAAGERHRAAVRLRQGCLERIRRGRRDRDGRAGRQERDRRSEGQDLRQVPWRDRADAEPPRTAAGLWFRVPDATRRSWSARAACWPRASAARMVVTRGKDGMSVVPAEGAATHLRTTAREVFDVSGAGDTVAAAMALGLAAGGDIVEACTLANLAAGIVVGKRGTATVTTGEIIAALRPFNGRAEHAEAVLARQRAAARARLARAGPQSRVHERLLRPAASRPYLADRPGAAQRRPADRRPELRRCRSAGSRGRRGRCRTRSRARRCWRR